MKLWHFFLQSMYGTQVTALISINHICSNFSAKNALFFKFIFWHPNPVQLKTTSQPLLQGKKYDIFWLIWPSLITVFSSLLSYIFLPNACFWFNFLPTIKYQKLNIKQEYVELRDEQLDFAAAIIRVNIIF